MAFLLDSNVFIDAHKRYYGLGLCPGFWDWLLAANAAGAVASIEKVYEELKDFGDDLSVWAKARDDRFFLKPDADGMASLARVAIWASGQSYRPAAVAHFLSGADCLLVAQAHAGKHVVVTHELPVPAALKVVKIPDACRALGVVYVSPFQMLKSERAKFVLATAPPA